jgi:hypothetical protein
LRYCDYLRLFYNLRSFFAILRYNPGMDFQLVTSYTPRGDQLRAIDELMKGLAAGEKHQVIRGAPGLDLTWEIRPQAIGSSSPGMGGLSGMRSR